MIREPTEETRRSLPAVVLTPSLQTRDNPDVPDTMATRNVTFDDGTATLEALDTLEVPIIRRDDEDGRDHTLTRRWDGLHDELITQIREARDVARFVAHRPGAPNGWGG